MRPLAGKTFVVTGAASGIGRAIALECVRQGANVTLADRARDALAAAEAEAEAEAGTGGGGRAMAMEIDVSREEDVERLFAETVARFGRLDGAVANAGISGTPGDFLDIALADWDQVIAVNLTGIFLTCRAAARILVAQKSGGSLVATGSSTAIRVHPAVIPYVASKSAVHGMVTAMALSLAPHNIRVNTLVPGLTATPAVLAIPGHLEQASQGLPLGEPATPEELARYVCFALGDAAPHMTGSLLKIDSGRTIA